MTSAAMENKTGWWGGEWEKPLCQGDLCTERQRIIYASEKLGTVL